MRKQKSTNITATTANPTATTANPTATTANPTATTTNPMATAATTAIAAVTAVALFTLTACGTESGAGGGSGGSVQSDLPLTDVHWSVDSLTVDGKKTAAPAGASVEIGTDGRASARTGCNTIGAKVTVDGDTVTVGEKESTLIGCPEQLQTFEKALGRAFAGKLKATVEEIEEIKGDKGDKEGKGGTVQDRRLTLTTADGDAITLTSGPPAPLAGTEWTVSALTDGATATSLPQGTDGKAHFTFGEDGTVEGSFGCNSFRGTAKVSEAGTGAGEKTASTVTFGRLSSTRKLCPGPEMTLERQVQKVLEGNVTYELHHRSLTLKQADGQGLDAVAAASGK
ncbi:META domain-containing protein [Streptomyces sp. NPDC056909]|uniref:META domain-containing protein n=1 Tax=Streptomyces sp. NPDC056909 TaxID=3345963 RepID=UPI0036A0212D